MPSATKIRKTMQQKGIPEAVMARMDFTDTKENRPERMMALIRQMDALLSPEECLAVMEAQGCHITGKPSAAHRAFGRMHAHRTLAEKISLMATDALDTPHKAPCHINPDGTLSVYWAFGQAGQHRCVCGMVGKLPSGEAVPRTFCGCCGGHMRQNYQRSLGVKLRLKEIVSSAASSGGQKRCEFLYEIVE